MNALSLTVMPLLLSAHTRAPAEVREADVVLKVEIENYGHTKGLKPVGLPDSSGGYAMVFGDERTSAMGGVKLEPGEYSLLLRAWAPAGDQDGFFVEIDGERQRRVAPQGRWTVKAYNFKATKARVVPISIIGQEAGLAVDQLAVVRGTFKTGQLKMAQVPGETAKGKVGLEELPRLVSACALKELPKAPFKDDANTILRESFDGKVAGAVGDHHSVDGKFGEALHLDMPDGRFDIDASDLELGPTGTIEFWIRPRPAQRLWHDQGWHYFLHCKPADGKSFQLDLSRHPRTQLQLTASRGDGPPYKPDDGPRERVRLSTGNLDVEAWHHLLVSWDLTGEKQHLWLLIDGEGMQSFFEPAFKAAGFGKIEIGNTPSGWEVPFLSIDGAIDELKISNVSVADRLAE